MKRRPLFLAATIAELLRFFALIALAQQLGLFKTTNGALRLFRYAAAPQLLFAAGFFFLWLDLRRYAVYRPLIVVGKLANLAALVPLALLMGDYLRTSQVMTASPSLLIALVGTVSLVDVGALALAALSGGRAMDSGAAPSLPGQGPGDIEDVED